ncbi:ATP-binding protein [Actinomadura viridis]|uniref:Anti-sigma regulatory factor (Ser/Thr protein kinase) n=1 Tax=Actinomadura viridis TaxID=58110 RepID=A0A931GL43_9ACTN|nr:ATP-binding protein [Actinomadura viridis]MBG6090740.1 anti-sigma regulatory factor (Ser/Thr protein kinase) [Actinomadura viridis]
MIVDQADDVAAPAAPSARRHPRRHHAPDHPPRPGARTPSVAHRAPSSPAAVSGLAGLWPAPSAGVPRTARRVLPAEPTSPKEARAFTRATLREWGVDGAAADDALVAVSELVTNALQHGLRGLPRPLPAGPIQLVLLGHPRRLVVTVTDPGERTPEPIAPDPVRSPEGGRGLLVLGALSDAWGWAPLATGGKAVWAAFDLPAGSSSATA